MTGPADSYWALMGYVSDCLKRNGFREAAVEFRREAQDLDHDYDDLKMLSMEYVELYEIDEEGTG